MSLRGSIEDVPVIDVLQFIHLSGKSGTLSLESAEGEAAVEFCLGDVVFARGPGKVTLGQLLVGGGAVGEDALARALVRQEKVQLPLGRLLVEDDAITREQLGDCVRRQIHAVIMQIVTWDAGTFAFDQTSGSPVDDLRVELTDVLPEVKLNTQFLLLEAVRLLDEARHSGEVVAVPHLPTPRAMARPASIADPEPAPAPPAAPPPLRADALPPARAERRRDAPPARLEGSAGARSVAPGVLFVGFERPLLEALRRGLAAAGIPVLGHVPLLDVDEQVLGRGSWPRTLALVWRVRADDAKTGRGSHTAQCLARVSRVHPNWATVILASGTLNGSALALYEGGARAVLPVAEHDDHDRDMLARSLAAVLSHVSREADWEAQVQQAELRAWLQAKRVTNEMQQALQKASVALELMRVASGAVERAVLFLAKEDGLIGLGAFGQAANGRPLAELLRGLAIDVVPDSPLSRCLGERRVVNGATRELGMSPLFFDLAGRPAYDRGVLVPILGPSKTIGILYGDNGSVRAPMSSIHALELAAANAGIAYENILLRMKPDNARAAVR